jgi:hypothetical protein
MLSTTVSNTTPQVGPDREQLSLDVEELEAMEAPDFWDGFAAGLGIAGIVAGGVGIGVAIT